MKVVKAYPDGLFCWVDLMTSDILGAKQFYKELFGWQFVDITTDKGPIYTMCQLEGLNVAGLSQMSPDLQSQGMPPVWSSYIKHDHVDQIADRIDSLGGKVIMPLMEIMQEGRMLMATDPSGAVFGVWQPMNHIGAQLVNMPNTLIWNELQTHDIKQAQNFYCKLFGWDASMDESDYVSFSTDKRVHAGMMQIQKEWGEVPPNWSIYFMVDDIEDAVTEIKRLGGNLGVPPTAVGEMGTFSVVQDPQGAFFTIMQFYGPVDDPPGY